MKRSITVIFFNLFIIPIIIAASSYRSTDGVWKGRAVILHVHHGDIYNIRRGGSGKVRHLHITRSSVRIEAREGFLIRQGGYVRIKGAKQVFSGYGGGRKGYFLKSSSVSSRGHVSSLHLAVTIINKRTGREFTFNRSFKVGRGIGTGKDGRLNMSEKLQITPR